MAAHVKSLGFTSHNGKGKPIASLKSHIKYIEADKDHHLNKPELFNKDQDKVERKDFFKKLGEQPQRGVVGHKLVISLSADEQQKLGTDMKQLVRDTMDRFEIKHNVKLDWVGSIHNDEGHPHCHIVIRGYDDLGKQVGMYPKHIKDFQHIADQEKERQFERQPEMQIDRDIFKELEQEQQMIPELGKSWGLEIDDGR